MRTGVVAKKIGMSRYYTAEGIAVPVTLLQLDECQVVSIKTKATDGYDAVQVGAGEDAGERVWDVGGQAINGGLVP